MKTLKLVTIGGGSSYTPELVEGMILRSKELPISEWWFVDTPEGQEKLEIVVALAQRMVTKVGLDWTIKARPSRNFKWCGFCHVTISCGWFGC
ncbi:alpha-galactosidase/6-phospho-beta-glucosidase [Streptococcus acidominimus]|uniref:Alpha-galactosidase/6-phospho-beta-glucosidase n=1 Tax=Streptococcus acidominimus TaxID=1326 RepID=A0A239WVV1_STRAI|nr:alpha-galactosidase/6-phospho-beta-glucosidase [Streptococcus acidominimus]